MTKRKKRRSFMVSAPFFQEILSAADQGGPPGVAKWPLLEDGGGPVAMP